MHYTFDVVTALVAAATVSDHVTYIHVPRSAGPRAEDYQQRLRTHRAQCGVCLHREYYDVTAPDTFCEHYLLARVYLYLQHGRHSAGECPSTQGQGCTDSAWSGACLSNMGGHDSVSDAACMHVCMYVAAS